MDFYVKVLALTSQVRPTICAHKQAVDRDGDGQKDLFGKSGRK